jgi:hypothetical protein
MKRLVRHSCGISARSSSRCRNELNPVALVGDSDGLVMQMKQNTYIPTEIVDNIIALVLALSSQSFASIASVSLASSDFRQIALRLFFSTIKSRSRTRWSNLWYFLASANRNSVHGTRPHGWVRCVPFSYMRIYAQFY